MSQANLDRFLQEARTNTSLSDRMKEVRSHDELIKLLPLSMVMNSASQR